MPRLKISLLLCLLLGALPARELSRLALLSSNQPRAFFFRASEQAASARLYPDFESWDRPFGRLMGVMGKCLDEEVLEREARNLGFFNAFKARHPEQAVLLHFNGNARDPRYKAEKYFPGHWIYREATPILADVPAEEGVSTLRVASARDFKTATGRYRNANDDLALFAVAPDGRHDWGRCEQVSLVSADAAANTITVKRAQYGTRPLAFKGGAARAAAHEVEGPWGKNNHLLWFYNYAVHCPRDGEGKTCADRLVDDFAHWFAPGGVLSNFDGVEFDVFYHETSGDTDGDGKVDDGILGGVNQYGVGVIEYARKLRARMGEDFLLLGDGALGPGGVHSQRAFGLLNGIESEGFPNLGDWAFEDWSGGLNRHAFWARNGRSPAISYINHKWNEPVPGQIGEHRAPEVPPSRHRLAMAGAVFSDAAICYILAPAKDEDGLPGIWDELRAGRENRLGWLGTAEGPVRHLAKTTPDLLGGAGKGEGLLKLLSGEAAFQATASGVRITAKAPSHVTAFTLRGIPVRGPDLFVELVMGADPTVRAPPEQARFVKVSLCGGLVDLLAAPAVETGMALRGAPETPLDRETGAALARRTMAIDGESRPGYFAHPPYQGVKGYTYWVQEAVVPEASALRFFVSMGEKSPERSDGVWFSVHTAEAKNDALGEYAKIFETNTREHRFLPCRVDLGRFAGRRLRLKFVADCGPKDHAVADQAHWGSPCLAPDGADPASLTPAATSMTWASAEFFTSGFSFRELRSPRVDLAISIEGPEPVTIRSVSAHASSDATARLFSRGLVLANPGLRPQAFDLPTLSPGRSYRRLRGVPSQDPSFNNGAPAGGTITLGERDAIFLMREP